MIPALSPNGLTSTRLEKCTVMGKHTPVNGGHHRNACFASVAEVKGFITSSRLTYELFLSIF